MKPIVSEKNKNRYVEKCYKKIDFSQILSF